MPKLRVVVADDHHGAALQQLISLLEAEFLVVATAKNGEAALECVRKHRPDVVVLDLEMPMLNGIETASRLGEMPSPPGVVICSSETDLEVVEFARQTGAIGYVFKANMARDLVEAVKSAWRGEPFVSPRWSGPLIGLEDPELLCAFK